MPVLCEPSRPWLSSLPSNHGEKEPQSYSPRAAQSCCCSCFHRHREEKTVFLKNPQGSHKTLVGKGERMLSRELISSLVEVPLRKSQEGCLPCSSESTLWCAPETGPVSPSENEWPEASPSPAGAGWWPASCQDDTGGGCFGDDSPLSYSQGQTQAGAEAGVCGYGEAAS